jgi:Fic family protein
MQNKYKLTPKENVFLAKKILVVSIYNSAHLEGINVTFPDTQTIIDGVTVSNMSTDDLQVILNLRNAWKYTLDHIEEPLTLDLMLGINARVSYNESLDWGNLRTGEIGISGTNWRPPIPHKAEALKTIDQIFHGDGFECETDRALTFWAWAMRTQLFWDGNKRTAGIAANLYMISHGLGVISVPVKEIANFNRALTAFYDSDDYVTFGSYAYESCIHGMQFMQLNGTSDT